MTGIELDGLLAYGAVLFLAVLLWMLWEFHDL
jgi:hypothetical protein